MTRLTVSSKGSVVIPAELRRKVDLRPGAKVMVVDYGGVLAVVPAFERPIEEAAGLLKNRPALAKALRVERARERRRER